MLDELLLTLDAGTESLGVAEAEDTSVVDLGLDKGGVVLSCSQSVSTLFPKTCQKSDLTHKVGLRADLEGDTAGGRLGVVNGLGTGLDVLGDLVVVAGSEGAEVAETVEGDGVLGGREADGTGVAGDGAREDVVRGLGTDQEAVPADNGVGGEGGALLRRGFTAMEKSDNIRGKADGSGETRKDWSIIRQRGNNSRETLVNPP